MGAGALAAPGAARPHALLPAVYLISASLLVLEIALTRIFSVLLWYHYAVLSISLALFGSSAAGIFVYLFPRLLSPKRVGTALSLAALAYSLSVIVSFAVLTSVPIQPNVASDFLKLALIYGNLAVPFFLGGVCLALSIRHLAASVSAVYFADLWGAASGCLLVVPSLDLLGGAGTVILAAAVGAVAAILFGLAGDERRLRKPLVLSAVALTALLPLNPVLGLLRVRYVKGADEPPKLYEGWNSFSRVVVFPETKAGRPFGWGLSERYTGPNPGWMKLSIDGMAETPINRFDGDYRTLGYLSFDVSSAVHDLKKGGRVLVIGAGGGRDVLAALALGQKAVDAVELNPLIVEAVQKRFADYAGHIYDDPRVQIFVDDGRSFLAKSSRRYDIIQASAVDSWAATAAGAFALSENALYTQEAFRTYFDHLSADGILAFSRYVYPRDRYGEVLRLTGLALTAWGGSGVADPREHLMLVGALNAKENAGYVSLLMKRSPFTRAEVDTVRTASEGKGFTVLYAPFGLGHGLVREFVLSPDYVEFWKRYPIDVSPPTDDKPFFFQMLRLGDIARLGLPKILASEPLRAVPMIALGTLQIIVTLLVVVFVLGPLWVVGRDRRGEVRGQGGTLLYFSCLGLGFMTIEIALLQRFVLFMGHPVYALTVVLLTLLLAAGLGSLSTRRVEPRRAVAVASWTGGLLVVLLPAYILLVPRLHYSLMGASQVWKVALSIGALFPAGFLMGTLFPLGVKWLTVEREEIIPWCWAANGATSVFASVLGLIVAVQLGIRATMILGTLAYACATLLLVRKRLARREAEI